MSGGDDNYTMARGKAHYEAAMLRVYIVAAFLLHLEKATPDLKVGAHKVTEAVDAYCRHTQMTREQLKEGAEKYT